MVLKRLHEIIDKHIPWKTPEKCIIVRSDHCLTNSEKAFGKKYIRIFTKLETMTLS